MLPTTRYVCVAVVLFHANSIAVPLKQNDDDSSRIVNGDRATEGQFPYAVSLQYISFVFLPELHTHTCTLSLITTKTCLGAAHCAVGEDGLTRIPVPQLCGITGTIDQRSPTAICHKYSAVNVHPLYIQQLNINDVCTFIFYEEMKPNNLVNTVALLKSTKMCVGCAVTAIGWGKLHTLEDKDVPSHLRYVNLTTVANDNCHVTPEHICLKTNGKGVCSGDSGGPNVVMQNGKPVQVGISTNVVTNCAIKYSFSALVGSFVDWILNNCEGKPNFINEIGQ